MKEQIRNGRTCERAQEQEQFEQTSKWIVWGRGWGLEAVRQVLVSAEESRGQARAPWRTATGRAR